MQHLANTFFNLHCNSHATCFNSASRHGNNSSLRPSRFLWTLRSSFLRNGNNSSLRPSRFLWSFLSSGMAILVRYILHFFFAASFFTFGGIMRTQGEKVEGAFDSNNQAAFAAALTAMLSVYYVELKSLWLALFADAV